MRLSSSKIKCYKACKRKYYFSYIEGLKPVQDAQTLVDGSNYHAMLESLYNFGAFETDIDNPKVSAMAIAYQWFVYPQFKVRNAEQWFELPLGKRDTLVGRFDGIAEDGRIVEHKTTSGGADEEYIYGLQWDEQILNYMLASGNNHMYYTVCQKPTIRLKQNETNVEFLARCVDWFNTDTENKIRVIDVTRDKREIAEHRKELHYIAGEMIADERKGEKAFYRNPSYCMAYGRRCEFASICLDYDPTLTYVEFTKKDENYL